ncbi:MAG: hypothetical protein A2Z38_08405 [Planctomycetes bacterium RBG_19FT_COMBO_48_8]|nr:MAG: hypothetical protein A2Z38_08405 [Planctomycetes bacterium RBG_19FT_COMBO_48_8]
MTRFNAGIRIAIRIAIIAMTTSSSINVNPRDLRILFYPPTAIITGISRLILPGNTVELPYHEYTKTDCQMQLSSEQPGSTE